MQLLKEWAQWGKEHNIGYPSMSPMFGERALKSALYGGDAPPPDVMEVDAAVCRISTRERAIIHMRYQRKQTYRELSAMFSVRLADVESVLRAAENAVHVELKTQRINDAIPATKLHG